MKLLVLSFYYSPDLSAGSFRATALVQALRQLAPHAQIDVVTTLPNRYSSFNQAAQEIESHDGLEIRRIPLPAHRSDMLGQSRAFAHFARRSLAHTAARAYDAVFATSSRLMTAALGARIARRGHTRLYLDLRDIFVETIHDVLPGPLGFPVKHAFAALERWTIRSADRINLVSPAFESYFRERYGELSLAAFTNGVDDEFVAAALAGDGTRTPAADGRLRIVYAGNIGESQALHEIVPPLARELRDQAQFIVIGDGGRRAALAAALEAQNVGNVELRAPVARSELLAAYRAADVLFLHLGPQPAFERVLPSKLFEYAAIGKPVLAGVGGYSARFVRDEISNAAVFAPTDVRGAVTALRSLRIADAPRPEFVAKFARSSIAVAMARDILQLAGSR